MIVRTMAMAFAECITSACAITGRRRNLFALADRSTITTLVTSMSTWTARGRANFNIASSWPATWGAIFFQASRYITRMASETIIAQRILNSGLLGSHEVVALRTWWRSLKKFSPAIPKYIGRLMLEAGND